jgi:hypothetical protein
LISAAARQLKHSTPPAAHLGSIYRLADHLDATLALGEDFLRQSLDLATVGAGDAHATIMARQNALSAFARTLRALELGITSRLLQARLRAKEVRDDHQQFAPLLGLFIGGTAPLADAAAGLDGGLGNIAANALMGGTQIADFLSSRGLIETGVQSLASIQMLAATEDYLVAERIHLGTLLDMVARSLEALDLAFDLYAEPRNSDVIA